MGAKEKSNGNGNGKNADGRRAAELPRGDVHAPDAITLLEIDHRKIESLFAAYAVSSPEEPDGKWQIVAALRRLLGVHGTIEEEILYPAAYSAGSHQTAHEVAEALHEHQFAAFLLANLESCRPEHGHFDASVEALAESIQRHFRKEETGLFVDAREHLSAERLVALGVAMEHRRAELTGHSRPEMPEEDPDLEAPDRANRLRASMGIE